jgi:hypothetical protein
MMATGLLTITSAHGQQWQQRVNHTIDVRLDDREHTLQGFEQMEYFNQSPDTLRFIWFHLWPNAYKNDKSAFSEQLLGNGKTHFYFSEESQRGYINQLDFKVNNQSVVTQDSAGYADMIKVLLPQPLAPGGKINITTPFHVKLPAIFSRMGHSGRYYQLTQWFPKPAVYDQQGWHVMPYLDQGEFYSEFGDYEVRISVPKNYVVAATGNLQEAFEKAFRDSLINLTAKGLNTRKGYVITDKQEIKKVRKKAYAKKDTSQKAATVKAVPNNPKNTVGSKTVAGKTPAPKDTGFATVPYKTITFKQSNVHDFAWYADPHFIIQHDTLQLNGRTIDCYSYSKTQRFNWANAARYAKQAIRFYSKHVGPYPYDVISVVEGMGTGGGMEYPTITDIQADSATLETTIVHEVGHNWFYGILASNERQHPWMDEGMNTYYEYRYERAMHQRQSLLDTEELPAFLNNKLPAKMEDLVIHTAERLHKMPAIDSAAPGYTELMYGMAVYFKAAQWMDTLEKRLGTATFDKAMQQYYADWKFRHPTTTDFVQSIEQSTGSNLSQWKAGLYQPRTPPRIHKRTAITGLFSLKNTDSINYISLAPAIGINYYDKLMLGVMVHNYQLPLNRFQFLAIPMYAIGSKKLNVFGRVSHNTWTKRSWLEVSGSIAKYTADNFITDQKEKLSQQVLRLVPSVKYTLYNKDARSTQRWILQARSFILREDQLDFRTITTPNGDENTVTTVADTRVVNQLKITTADVRVLYPYQLNLTIDQGKDFIRAGFTGDYFFNYRSGKGGIEARVFAGKFFYTTSKTFIKQFETDRYHLNMSGPKGDEDYTYSDYFIGRNEFEGWTSQQIMRRDGFFKVRTDLLGNKIGKTDDWLVAMNFSGDIPAKYNPLQVLPIKIPLKFFVDFGTYADAWKENPATGRFLYDAGLQLPLFNSLVNVYVPLLYSKVYRDYFKSTLGDKRFLKTISFSIDIQQLQLHKITKGILL